MKHFLLFFTIIVCNCSPKVQKEVVLLEDHKEAITPLKSKKIIFCDRTFERVEKINFLNNVYRAFHWGDSSLLRAYLTNPITISIESMNSENAFTEKILSKEDLKNWTTFLNEISTEFGTSVCTKIETRNTEYHAEDCIKNQFTKGKTYFKYVHFDIHNNNYELSGIGLVSF